MPISSFLRCVVGAAVAVVPAILFGCSGGTVPIGGTSGACGSHASGTTWQDACNTCSCTQGATECTTVVCLDAGGSDSGTTGDGSPSDAAAADAGAPCTSNGECPTGFECAYAVADTCSAVGSCQPTHPSTTCTAALVCACDGTASAVECNLPPGYASKPVTGNDACLTSCTFGGKTYANGSQFPSSCNTCTCTNGSVVCTNMACLDAGPPDAGPPLDAGAPCTASSQCGSGYECGYLRADLCSATGSCQPTHVTGGCASAALCACDGTIAVSCNLPTGYVTKPVTGNDSCFSDAAADGG